MNPILNPIKNFSRDSGSVLIEFYVMGFIMEFIMRLIIGLLIGFIMGLRNHFNPLCTDWVEKQGQ
jgi:hypothetical protein